MKGQLAASLGTDSQLDDNEKNVQDLEAKVASALERVKAQRVAAKYMWPIPNRGLSKRIHRVKAPVLLAWGERYPSPTPMFSAEEGLKGLSTGTLNAEDTAIWAEAMRDSKHADPMYGIVAAYLYNAIGDVSNICGLPMLSDSMQQQCAASDGQVSLFGSNYQDVFAFFVLILVLIFRPSGLLGERVADRA